MMTMATSAIKPDETWSALAGLVEDARLAEMRRRFREIVDLPGDERLAAATAMVLAEYRLDDPSLRAFTCSRLRAWLALAAEGLEKAQLCARTYDAVFDRLPGALAMRRVEVVQVVAREQLSTEEVEALQPLIPDITRMVPRAAAVATPAATLAGGGHKKPAWKFW